MVDVTYRMYCVAIVCVDRKTELAAGHTAPGIAHAKAKPMHIHPNWSKLGASIPLMQQTTLVKVVTFCSQIMHATFLLIPK